MQYVQLIMGRGMSVLCPTRSTLEAVLCRRPLWPRAVYLQFCLWGLCEGTAVQYVQYVFIAYCTFPYCALL
jgi:hypothetical protein